MNFGMSKTSHYTFTTIFEGSPVGVSSGSERLASSREQQPVLAPALGLLPSHTPLPLDPHKSLFSPQPALHATPVQLYPFRIEYIHKMMFCVPEQKLMTPTKTGNPCSKVQKDTNYASHPGEPSLEVTPTLPMIM